jgi:hypothetical protein
LEMVVALATLTAALANQELTPDIEWSFRYVF